MSTYTSIFPSATPACGDPPSPPRSDQNLLQEIGCVLQQLSVNSDQFNHQIMIAAVSLNGELIAEISRKPAALLEAMDDMIASYGGMSLMMTDQTTKHSSGSSMH